jgi:hypothetical protein
LRQSSVGRSARLDQLDSPIQYPRFVGSYWRCCTIDETELEPLAIGIREKALLLSQFGEHVQYGPVVISPLRHFLFSQ